jgi:hypothetical protein
VTIDKSGQHWRGEYIGDLRDRAAIHTALTVRLAWRVGRYDYQGTATGLVVSTCFS